jgi:hypothetical protein
MMISERERKQVHLCFEWKKPIVTMVFLLVLSLIFFSSQSWGDADDYRYIELLPPGWTSAVASGINNAGVVVGVGVGLRNIFTSFQRAVGSLSGMVCSVR